MQETKNVYHSCFVETKTGRKIRRIDVFYNLEEKLRTSNRIKQTTVVQVCENTKIVIILDFY